MTEIEIFEVPGGFGFRVGCVFQDYEPDCEGFVRMSEARARELAEIVAHRLE